MKRSPRPCSDLESLLETIKDDSSVQLVRASGEVITSSELHELARSTKNPAVHKAIAQNPRTTFSTLSFLVLASPDDTLLEVLAHVSTHPETLSLLLDKLASRVKENKALLTAYAGVYARLQLIDPVGVALRGK